MVVDRRISTQARYPHRLNFYLYPPKSTITVEDVELWALDRLQVLKALESAMIRIKSDTDISSALQPTLQKFMPLSTNLNQTRKAAWQEERQKDHVSHFILRLAFSKTSESRAWFLRFETALFKLRFTNATTDERQAFLEQLPDFHQKMVSPETKRAMAELLRAGSGPNKNVDQEAFVEVDFVQVLDLVQRRQVYLHGGKAYLPISDQAVLVVNEFKKRLEKSLTVMAKMLTRIDEEDRLGPILENLSSQQASMEYRAKNTSGEISAQDIDAQSVHFPMCMRHLQSTLKDQGHLRHGGRMQYNLFLKGIGVSLEEVLIYWRQAFRHITDDKFQKEHTYSFRHMYGLEGKRTNYSPYSCNKIITSNQPGAGDYHGCPFKHFSKDQLATSLRQQQLSDGDVNGIIDLAQQGHCQLACTRQFEVTHRAAMAKPGRPVMPPSDSQGTQGRGGATATLDTNVDRIIHPNQFYDQSVALVAKEIDQV
ncbi:eukaryotic and archaeal DNA primase, large subunit-domain-containing protein [Dimargaris cristalligena]|uniref:DNA primase large subunit n=1 Tax=Dimargaris cristalligena TaxID=215637 RepID=A0A4V1J5N8_9FUNG|nr:eukaryotic and archaeal DNA primase, large subunit-domain-containing protein [Dimargaris cristalligena]|eukprot:RKP39709.1 eukaryotic and archaeal DNA primase, large subunit-domain-containing protein [Dimargaris cristalligena]